MCSVPRSLFAGHACKSQLLARIAGIFYTSIYYIVDDMGSVFRMVDSLLLVLLWYNICILVCLIWMERLSCCPHYPSTSSVSSCCSSTKKSNSQVVAITFHQPSSSVHVREFAPSHRIYFTEFFFPKYMDLQLIHIVITRELFLCRAIIND